MPQLGTKTEYIYIFLIISPWHTILKLHTHAHRKFLTDRVCRRVQADATSPQIRLPFHFHVPPIQCSKLPTKKLICLQPRTLPYVPVYIHRALGGEEMGWESPPTPQIKRNLLSETGILLRF